jgi:hypothetical protein
VDGDEPAVRTVAVQQRLHASGLTVEEDVALLLQLLGTYRPGYQPAWGAHAAVT